MSNSEFAVVIYNVNTSEEEDLIVDTIVDNLDNVDLPPLEMCDVLRSDNGEVAVVFRHIYDDECSCEPEDIVEEIMKGVPNEYRVEKEIGEAEEMGEEETLS